jgi:hypothetical protein
MSDDPLIQADSILSPPTVDEVRTKACDVSYGKRLVENGYRGLVAEIIVGAALGSEWRLCSGDWGGWDLEHVTDRCRLEVKQSAARQTWVAPKKSRPPRFGIPERTGYYEDGVKWTALPQRGRPAHIYVFAYHPIRDDSADHRDASQWQFHVVAADRLPASQSIGLAKVISLSAALPWAGLRIAIEKARKTVMSAEI